MKQGQGRWTTRLERKEKGSRLGKATLGFSSDTKSEDRDEGGGANAKREKSAGSIQSAGIQKAHSQNSPEPWGGRNEGAVMKSTVQTSALTPNSPQDAKER